KETIMSKWIKPIVILAVIGAFIALESACKNENGNMANNNSTAARSSKNASTPGTGNALSEADREFMMQAANGGMGEVELGRIAEQRAANNDVKTFGKRMVDDHSKANDELMRLASEKGVTVPKSPEGKEKDSIDQLSKLSGNQFDREYIE